MFDAGGIVLGCRGYGELKGLLVGSVSNKLLHHAEVPVTIVRCPVPLEFRDAVSIHKPQDRAHGLDTARYS